MPSKKTIYDEQIQRILRVANRLQIELQLEWIHINHRFNEAPHEEGNLAVSETQWEYRQADITWALTDVAAASDEELEKICIHEYMHILLGPLEEFLPKKSQKQEEFAVESLTRAIMAARSVSFRNQAPINPLTAL